MSANAGITPDRQVVTDMNFFLTNIDYTGSVLYVTLFSLYK